MPFFVDPRAKPSHIYSRSNTDNGVTVTVSNVRLAQPFPQQKTLTTGICVENPNHYSLSVEGQLVYSGGKKEIGEGISSNSNPSCDYFEWDFSPDDEITQVEIDILALTNWSYMDNGKLECARIAEGQKILDEWNTGIKVSCQQNDGFNQWLEQTDYIPPPMTEEEADDWILKADQIAFDKVLVTHGAWNFSVSKGDIYNLPNLNLLDAGSVSPIQKNLNVQAFHLRRDGEFIEADVCLNSSVKQDWEVWNAELNYGNGKIKKQFSASATDENNCQTLSFDIPNDTSILQAQLVVFGISFPPNDCKEYLPELQSALNKTYFGLLVRCEYYDDGSASPAPVIAPIWISRFDANWLVNSTELYTIKGNWTFNLTISP